MVMNCILSKMLNLWLIFATNPQQNENKVIPRRKSGEQHLHFGDHFINFNSSKMFAWRLHNITLWQKYGSLALTDFMEETTDATEKS